MERIYYVANEEFSDRIYGDETPVCLDLNEIKILAREWDMTTAELLEQFHEASHKEIEEFGFSSGF